MKMLRFIFVLFFVLPYCLFAQTEGSFRNYYAGWVDDSSKFQMDLTIGTDHVKGVLNYYTAGRMLSLEGEPSAEGSIRLLAADDKDSSAGAFYCRLDPFSDSINGTWINAKGNRSHNFSMHKIAEYILLGQQSDFIKAVARIPQFLLPKPVWQDLNLSLNDINSEYVNNFVADRENYLVVNKTNIFSGWEYQTDYFIQYYSDNFVSLLIRTDEFTVSDRPKISYASRNIEVSGNDYRDIKLSELFLPGSGYIKKLSDYIIRDLKSKNADWIKRGEAGALDEHNLNIFSITPGYIEFTFPPGVAAPYERGAWSAKVPYSIIAQYVNPKSILNEFIKYGINYYDLVPAK